MRRRPTLIAIMLMVGLGLMDMLASSFAKTEIHARPVFLSRDDQRIPVWFPDRGEKSQPLAAATMTADAMRYFGRIRQFRTPLGETVTCDHVLYWMWCDGNWQAERA